MVQDLYVVPTVLKHRASLASLLGSLSSLSAKGGNVRSQKEGRTLSQLASSLAGPGTGLACAGRGSQREGLSQGIISTTSSPAGWQSPYSGFLDEYFVFSQTMSSAGKGSSFSSFPCVFTGHQMLSSKQAKSPHMPTASKR